MTVTRFAPAPTGRLHLGNLRTAVLNWLAARKGGGKFLLRIDDTDRERSREEHVQAIRDDLAWLGIPPDGEARQSERFERYEAEFARLQAAGRLYPAYETPEELELSRRVRLGRGLPPVYDRAALRLTDAERAHSEAKGRRPHWRFRLDGDRSIAWNDGVRGPQHFDPHQLGDPVIRRADGSWLYLFPSVVDDIDFQVTDVVRGEDHVSNSAVQTQMWEALGAAPPRLAHTALLVGADGKLSKREGSAGVDALRADGIEPLAVLALLARLGTSLPVEPVASPDALIERFDLSTFGRAPAHLDPHELETLSARTLHMLPYEAVRARLPAAIGPEAWPVVRSALHRIEDAADWVSVLGDEVVPTPPAPDDCDYLAAAADIADDVPWDGDPWHALTAELKARTGRKGRALFLPLRIALTGRAEGPEMAALLPLIPKPVAIARLRDAGAPSPPAPR